MNDPNEIYLERARRLHAAETSDREIDLDVMYMDADKREIVWREINRLRSESTPVTLRRLEPIATRAAAEAAYRETGSERKAAKQLHVSKTHLRRLLGKEE